MLPALFGESRLHHSSVGQTTFSQYINHYRRGDILWMKRGVRFEANYHFLPVNAPAFRPCGDARWNLVGSLARQNPNLGAFANLN
jgi:hypothetical protein